MLGHDWWGNLLCWGRQGLRTHWAVLPKARWPLLPGWGSGAMADFELCTAFVLFAVACLFPRIQTRLTELRSSVGASGDELTQRSYPIALDTKAQCRAGKLTRPECTEPSHPLWPVEGAMCMLRRGGTPACPGTDRKALGLPGKGCFLSWSCGIEEADLLCAQLPAPPAPGESSRP